MLQIQSELTKRYTFWHSTVQGKDEGPQRSAAKAEVVRLAAAKRSLRICFSSAHEGL